MVLLPPSSPDLEPCYFFLFPKMKLKLKGRRFDTIEQIQAETKRVLDIVTEKKFQEAFTKWRRRWDRYVHAGGNYFEGDDGAKICFKNQQIHQLFIQFINCVWWRPHMATHHATKHNTPIHNILLTAPQFSISQKALGTLPETGNVMPKHVGATIHN
jgi:hypothetical protein